MVERTDVSVTVMQPVAPSEVVVGDPEGVHTGTYTDDAAYQPAGVQPHVVVAVNVQPFNRANALTGKEKKDEGLEGSQYYNSEGEVVTDKKKAERVPAGFGFMFELDGYRDALTETSATASNNIPTRVVEWGGGLAVLPNWTFDFARHAENFSFKLRPYAGVRFSGSDWSLAGSGQNTDGITVMPGQECVEAPGGGGCTSNPAWQVGFERGANFMFEFRPGVETYDVVSASEKSVLTGAQSDFVDLSVAYSDSLPIAQQIQEAKALLAVAQRFLEAANGNSSLSGETTVLKQKIAALQRIIDSAVIPVLTGPKDGRTDGEINSGGVISVSNAITIEMDSIIGTANSAATDLTRTKPGVTRGFQFGVRRESAASLNGITGGHLYEFPAPTNGGRQLFGDSIGGEKVWLLGLGYFQTF